MSVRADRVGVRVIPPPLRRRSTVRADEARALVERSTELLSIIDQLCLAPRPDRSR